MLIVGRIKKHGIERFWNWVSHGKTQKSIWFLTILSKIYKYKLNVSNNWGTRVESICPERIISLMCYLRIRVKHTGKKLPWSEISRHIIMYFCRGFLRHRNLESNWFKGREGRLPVTLSTRKSWWSASRPTPRPHRIRIILLH